MLLTIHNLPPDIDYANIKRIIQELCFVKVLLINLHHDENGTSKVTVSTVDASEAGIILQKLNGLEIEGYKLNVEHGHNSFEERSPSPSYEEKQLLTSIYNEFIDQIEPLQASLPPRISSPSISIQGDTSLNHTRKRRSISKSPLNRRKSRSTSRYRHHRSRSRSNGYNSRRFKRSRSRSKSPCRNQQRLKSSRGYRRSRNESPQSPANRRRLKSPPTRNIRSRSKSRPRSKSISRSPPRIRKNSHPRRIKNRLSKQSDDISSEIRDNKKCLVDTSIIYAELNETRTLTKERSTTLNNIIDNTLADPRHKTCKLNDEYLKSSNTATEITPYNCNNTKANIITTSNVLYNSNTIQPNEGKTKYTPNSKHPDNFKNMPFDQNFNHHDKLFSNGFQNNYYLQYDVMDGPQIFDGRYQRNNNIINNKTVPSTHVRENVACRQERPLMFAQNDISVTNNSNPHNNDTQNFIPFNEFDGLPQNVKADANHSFLPLQYTQAPRTADLPSLMDLNLYAENRIDPPVRNQFMNILPNPDTGLQDLNINNYFRNRLGQDLVGAIGAQLKQPNQFIAQNHLATPHLIKEHRININEKHKNANCTGNLKTNAVLDNEKIAKQKTVEGQQSQLLVPNRIVNNASNLEQTAEEPNEQIEATITKEPENYIKPKRKRPDPTERQIKECNKFKAWKENQTHFDVKITSVSSESEDLHYKTLKLAPLKLRDLIIQSTPKKPTYNEYNILKAYIRDKLDKLIKDKWTSLEPSEEVYVNFFLNEHKEESHREFMETYYKWCSEVFYLTEDDWDLEFEDTAHTNETEESNETKKKKKKYRSKQRNKTRRTGRPRNGGKKVGHIRLPSYKRKRKDPATTATLTESTHKNEDEAALENGKTINQLKLLEQSP